MKIDNSPVYCLNCSRKISDVKITTSVERVNMHGVGFRYIEKHALCPICLKEVYHSEINDINAQEREAAYVRAVREISNHV